MAICLDKRCWHLRAVRRGGLVVRSLNVKDLDSCRSNQNFLLCVVRATKDSRVEGDTP